MLIRMPSCPMIQQSSLRAWYERPQKGGSIVSKSLIDEAFEEAKAKFSSDLTRDSRKVDFLSSATSLKDVEDTVFKSLTKYESQRKDSKARRWLERLSQRVHFYSGILDVFSQHHPEYIALVWGTMKFLLVAVINHEKVIAALAKAISQIADTLPRVELATVLYPTDRMKAAVADLYVTILRFLIRSRDWYEEGRLHHFIHSITRPVELRYNDLLEQIAQNSRLIDQLAVSGQQAEFRDMHNKVNETSAIVSQINNAITLHSSALVDTNQRLSDLQFSQIMASLAQLTGWDPMKVYQYHLSLRRRRSHTIAVRSAPNSFWHSPKLRHWSSTDDSALSIIIGNFHARFIMRNICIDIVEQLQEAGIPVLLAMRPPEQGDTPTNFSPNDLLKYLVRQALQYRHKVQTEKSMAIKCATVHSATTEAEWFKILEAVLSEIEAQVYIVVDFEVLNRKTDVSSGGFSWAQAFEHFFNELLVRGLSTKVKVLLVSVGLLPLRLTAEDHSEYVIPLKPQLTTARQRKAGRGNAAKTQQVPFRLRNVPIPVAKKGGRRVV